ncbi:MAG: STAS domain-containing protein [Gaiellales bacterium]
MDAINVIPSAPLISLSGEIDLSNAASIFAELEPWIDSGGPIGLDFSGVTFMDSSGVQMLLHAASALGTRGCIIVHGVHDAVAIVLRLTNAREVPNIHVIECTILADAV